MTKAKAQPVDTDTQEAAAEALARQEQLAKELGVTMHELRVFTDFLNVYNGRLDGAPTAILVGTAETNIRQRMPNNAEACDPNAFEMIESQAAQFAGDGVFKSALWGLNRENPKLADAVKDYNGANARLMRNPGDTSLEATYASRVKWLTRLKCQDAQRDALKPIFEALFRLQTGGAFIESDTTQSEAATASPMSILTG